jgi:hypothetical protein
LEHTIGGPSLAEMLPRARRILRSEPLLLAALDLKSAERCLRELPAAGLCIMLAVSDYDIPLEMEVNHVVCGMSSR